MRIGKFPQITRCCEEIPEARKEGGEISESDYSDLVSGENWVENEAVQKPRFRRVMDRTLHTPGSQERGERNDEYALLLSIDLDYSFFWKHGKIKHIARCFLVKEFCVTMKLLELRGRGGCDQSFVSLIIYTLNEH